MIVSKYFDDIGDFINLELVCKKLRDNMGKFHYNLISLNFKTLRYFPKIETLHLCDVKDENFGNGFMINTEKNEEKNCFKGKVLLYYFETLSLKIEKFGNNIPRNVTSIGNRCYCGCITLSSINIPSNVTSIGKKCFYNCFNLSSVTIPSSVVSFCNSCFYDCFSLTSITIPSSIISLNNKCFWGCCGLLSVTIPSNVKSIGFQCFHKCESLSSVTIPSSVVSIGDDCFGGCSNLSSVSTIECYINWKIFAVVVKKWLGEYFQKPFQRNCFSCINVNSLF
ncbi:hypothetical protein EIN_444300 [Entamoeba invadens IP1]|uniref:Leucine rich repeat containing protein BspA family protein n=1 Tax=Entamoeba invadens IP1 TaxID=370355 RepID=A0A0A1UBA0_ENTIV|nr:hypothetical protein EIN_444300 [Entamoeba invadens IP1]ELP92390.1 hypothetical protein EIN_444300 [Entamoeba invadens IP1]|eukprot:XP_004259161.1 hypothetical protein EIN_444300 [Entamoeba invadens IP1]